MKTFPAAETSWARRLAARLRVLQTTCAEDQEDLRLGLLKDEVAQALREIAPAQRMSYLEALSEEFPAWQQPGGNGAAGQESEQTEYLPPLQPEQLVQQLVEAAPALPEAARQDFARRLAAVGLALPAPAHAAAPFELPGEVRARFALATNQAVDERRAMRLFALLAEVALALDQLVWSVWKSLAPQSIIRRDAGPDGDLRKLAARYLSGDSEVSGQQVAQVLEKSRHLIAGLLAGMGPAGGTFARNYLARFSPEAIEAVAGGGGGFLSNAEQKYWRKYVELFNQLSGPSVEREILNAITQYAESAILGPNRPPSPAAAPPGMPPMPPPPPTVSGR